MRWGMKAESVWTEGEGKALKGFPDSALDDTERTHLLKLCASFVLLWSQCCAKARMKTLNEKAVPRKSLIVRLRTGDSHSGPALSSAVLTSHIKLCK